jgi:hypothetical protein
VKIKNLINISLVVFFLLSAACSGIPTPSERILDARQLAENKGFKSLIIESKPFLLQSYYRFSENKETATLTVFIEGDGFAWASRNQPSFDPTPINPVALKMALQSQDDHVAYLARPCQYLKVENVDKCTMKQWTHLRFSELAVSASNEAIDELKQKSGAKQVRLVGFSGGAAIATIVAAKRSDVIQIITVAGNLNPVFWVEMHKYSPLIDSLNPIDYVDELEDIPQVHFVGNNDKNITVDVAQSYKQSFNNKANVKIIIVPEFTHDCCWGEHWLRLLEESSD